MEVTQLTIGDFIGTKLYRDYLLNFHRTAELFKYNPWERESYERRSKELRMREEQREHFRNELSLVLQNYHQGLTDNPAVFNSIELMKNTDTKVVVTGHQPGVLTGPLFAIYKAITTVKLASELSRQLGEPVIPVFWLASEDHDFQEINWIKTVNHKGEQVHHEIEHDSEGQSIKDRKIDDQGQQILRLLEMYFHGTPYYEKWMAVFQKAEKNSDNLADWTAQILLELFGDRGMLIVDPMEQGIRQLSTPVFEEALKLGESYYQTLNKSNLELAELGYEQQVELRENHTGLFYYYQDIRSPITVEGDTYQLANSGVEFTYKQLIQELRKAPQKFSPNVTLRPVLQDYLFPTLAYVAGPGEISYFAQLKNVYENLDVGMPVIYPRESYLLLEAEQCQTMENYKMSLASIFRNWDCVRKQVFKNISPVDTEDAFSKTVTKFQSEHSNYIEALSQIDDNIRELEKKNFHLIMRQLDYLKQKADYYFRKKETETERELNLLKAKLYPENQLQERAYNIGEFLFKYDYKLLTDLLEIPLNPQEINVVELKQ